MIQLHTNELERIYDTVAKHPNSVLDWLERGLIIENTYHCKINLNMDLSVAKGNLYYDVHFDSSKYETLFVMTFL